MRNFLNNHRFTECWTETCPNPCLCVTRHSASKCRTIQHFAGLLASQVTRTRTYIFLLARRSLICPTTHSFLNLRIRTPPFTLFSCLFISVTKPKTHAHQLNSLTTETVEKKWGEIHVDENTESEYNTFFSPSSSVQWENIPGHTFPQPRTSFWEGGRDCLSLEPRIRSPTRRRNGERQIQIRHRIMVD